MNAILIRADERVERVPVTSDFNYKKIQECVGGYFEAVGTRFRNISTFLNEEGKLKGLPYNDIATSIDEYSAVIVGDVLLMHSCINEGGDLDQEGFDYERCEEIESLLMIL